MRRGQAIVEYLVIATIIIAALVSAQARFRKSADRVYKAATGQLDASADGIGNLPLLKVGN